MKFTQRLAYYLFGFLIGGLFLVFVFGQKKTTFCYLPNCRVLQDLRTKPLMLSPNAEQELKEDWVNIDDVRNCLTYGKVDFENSKQDFENGKIYIIKGKNTKNEPIIVEMINYDDKVVLKDVRKE